MKAWRVWAVVVAVTVLLNVVGVGAGATKEYPKGYCTADDTPVVTYWPPGTENDYDVSCYQGRLSVMSRHEASIGDNPIAITNPATPDDFGRWVFVWLNGTRVINPYRDVNPYIVKSTGRTLIPLRFVSEAFGAQVGWEGSTRTVTIAWQGHQVVVTIDHPKAYADGKELLLEQPPLIWKDRTMVPLRFIVEAFGAAVDWEDQTDRVLITMPGVTCAPEYCLQ